VKRIRTLCFFLCVLTFLEVLHAQEAELPAPPSALDVDEQAVLNPAVFRTAARYLDRIEEAAGEEALLLFPGRSLTLLGVLAKARTLHFLQIPGSDLTDALSTDNWKDPVQSKKLKVYQELVAQEVMSALRDRPTRKIYVVDIADTGRSILYFSDMVRKILKEERAGLTPLSVEAAYIPHHRMSPLNRSRLEAQGVQRIELGVPWNTSGLSLSPLQQRIAFERLYFHQEGVSTLSGLAAPVRRLPLLEWDPTNPLSAQQFRAQYHERGGELYSALEAYFEKLGKAIGWTEKSTPALKIFQDCSGVVSQLRKKRAA
jgi:hypothetical protein